MEKRIADHEVYWRIYHCHDDKFAVVCMQWFDEFDYDEERFMTDLDGDRLQFFSEYHDDEFVDGAKIAREFLNKVVLPEFIREKDLIRDSQLMFKIPKEEW